MSPPDANNSGPGAGDKRPRRPRYPGRNPRRFEHRYKELDPQAYPGIREHIRARGRTPAGTHVPVMLREVMAWLKPASGEIVADCTIGYGGHAMEFMRRIGPTGRLIGFDVDGPNLRLARNRLEPLGAPFSLHHMNYAGAANVLGEEGIDGYDVIFADLGVSSMQVDDPSRGISYKHPDSPLDMRMDDRLKRTAADLLATLSEEDLSRALRELSDEPDHERIAEWIVNQRRAEPIADWTDHQPDLQRQGHHRKTMAQAGGVQRPPSRRPHVPGAADPRQRRTGQPEATAAPGTGDPPPRRADRRHQLP